MDFRNVGILIAATSVALNVTAQLKPAFGAWRYMPVLPSSVEGGRGASSSSVFGHRRQIELCNPSGGTLIVPPVGEHGDDISGSLGYGPSNCSTKSKIGLYSFSTAPYPCPYVSGFTELGVGVAIGSGTWTFRGTNSSASIASARLNPTTEYTIFLETDSGDVVYRYLVGKPIDNTLNFPSPFQNGFSWPGGDLDLLLCYR